MVAPRRQTRGERVGPCPYPGNRKSQDRGPPLWIPIRVYGRASWCSGLPTGPVRSLGCTPTKGVPRTTDPGPIGTPTTRSLASRRIEGGLSCARSDAPVVTGWSRRSHQSSPKPSAPGSDSAFRQGRRRRASGPYKRRSRHPAPFRPSTGGSGCIPTPASSLESRTFRRVEARHPGEPIAERSRESRAALETIRIHSPKVGWLESDDWRNPRTCDCSPCHHNPDEETGHVQPRTTRPSNCGLQGCQRVVGLFNERGLRRNDGRATTAQVQDTARGAETGPPLQVPRDTHACHQECRTDDAGRPLALREGAMTGIGVRTRRLFPGDKLAIWLPVDEPGLTGPAAIYESRSTFLRQLEDYPVDTVLALPGTFRHTQLTPRVGRVVNVSMSTTHAYPARNQ